jgi:hypothetical protein
MIKNISSLIPITDDNRDEKLLVQFSNVITNMNELITQLMYKNDYFKRYNFFLSKYAPMIRKNPNIVFDECLFCKEKDLLNRYNNTHHVYCIDPKTIEIDKMGIRDMYSFDNARNTIMLDALQKLAYEDFVKNIYIVDEWYDRKRIEYVRSLFPDIADTKVQALRNTVKEALLEKPDVTTVIMEDAEELYDILTTVDKDILENKVFMISAALVNVNNPDSSDATVEAYKHFKYFASPDIPEKLKCMVKAFYPYESNNNIYRKR